MDLDFASFKVDFFDTSRVMKRVAAGKRRVLSKIGAFVRQRAKTSIRKRKKSSPPGQPPSSHAGQLRLIFFAYDHRSESVVVGPIAFGARGGAGIVPRLLEFGGEVIRGGKRLVYRGNPFMRPAMEAELPKFEQQATDMLK